LLFSEKIHRYIFLFGILGLGFGMMLGAVPTSVPQLVLAGNWLAEGNFKWKWERLKSNKLFWVISALFIIHILGLLYTHNLEDGLMDIKTKIPLFFLPFLFFTAKPLSKKEFQGALYCFIAGCVGNTVWCLLYSFVLHQNEVVRNASRFMSHIRLGLYLNVAITACVYFVVKKEGVIKKVAFGLLAVYFISVLIILGLASGSVNFIILFLLALGVIIYRQKLVIKIAALVVLVTFITLVTNYVIEIRNAQLVVNPTANNELQTYSPSGRTYLHFEKKGQKENGNYVQINIQPDELQGEWKKRTPVDSFNYSSQHNAVRYEVLIRYLSSKGLNKDSFGIAQLTDKDVENIKKGVANYQHPNRSFLHKRIYELVNEYDEFVNKRKINGHSLTMRLYFWKAALHLIQQNVMLGVGTGDVMDELNNIYEKINSPLTDEWRLRPHNQFLTITVAFGVIGLIVFLIGIIYPVVYLKNDLPKLFWPFFIIAILSFFMEDTLETQAGCNFYAYFMALFVSVAWYKKKNIDLF
jgi:hypothetical protein